MRSRNQGGDLFFPLIIAAYLVRPVPLRLRWALRNHQGLEGLSRFLKALAGANQYRGAP